MLKSAQDLDKLRKGILAKRDPKKPCITICAGTGCQAYGCQILIKTFEDEIKARTLQDKIDLRTTGCHGFCERGPLVVIHPEGIFYQRVQLDDAKEIIEETILNKRIIERLLYVDPATGNRFTYEEEVPFYALQERLIFGSNSYIDPKSIEDYLARDGYSALSKALFEMKHEEVVEEVKRSGLRGRGGGGFPTGIKWEACRNAKSDDGVKYVICNADEGDPGAYMDRSLLEGNPHSVIEGMIIGAFGIGAHKGFIYVRNEYPLAVRNTWFALSKARELGLIGKNILGSGFDFDIKIVRGAGAFVSGEETGLMASIEGRAGRPKPKYVLPVVKGLWGKPTNINNVETWANVPLVISKGADWYSRIGTKNSTGTKIFSLVGKINNTGLVEVPMGITLREIVYDIGGGIPNGKKFKGVQTGGPSGGVIPESLLDLKVDFDELKKAGSMMGSGGMIVMDEDTCMVDIARYFLHFLKEESCGKCVACREGIKRMLEILNAICEGYGEEGDIELLEELAEYVSDTALCGLGTTAPNPVLTTIKYFRDEYEAHIKDKYCPAGVCKNLYDLYVDEEACTGCGLCAKKCPQDAIYGERKEAHEIDLSKCIKCGICIDVCRFNAIKKGHLKGSLVS